MGYLVALVFVLFGATLIYVGFTGSGESFVTSLLGKTPETYKAGSAAGGENVGGQVGINLTAGAAATQATSQVGKVITT